MGKSCLRFKKLEDVPLDVVGEAVARMDVDRFIEIYEKNVPGAGKSAAKKAPARKKAAKKATATKKAAKKAPARKKAARRPPRPRRLRRRHPPARRPRRRRPPARKPPRRPRRRRPPAAPPRRRHANRLCGTHGSPDHPLDAAARRAGPRGFPGPPRRPAPAARPPCRPRRTNSTAWSRIGDRRRGRRPTARPTQRPPLRDAERGLPVAGSRAWTSSFAARRPRPRNRPCS